jgi:phage pi2 protein 07
MKSALLRAAEHVDAVDLGDGRWAHYATETSSWWVVSAAELEELCEFLDSDVKDPYSHWCAGTTAEEMPHGWSP